MRSPTQKPFTSLLPASLCVVSLGGLLLGCANGGSGLTSPAPTAVAHLSGKVYGGQQPVSNSQIYLYAAGTATGGSRSMLNGPGYVLSQADGSFDITGDFNCDTGDQVYVLALGGDAGFGTNGAIGLMSAIGPCGSLNSNTYIAVNEVTTVASVYALSKFITSPTSVGANPVGSNAVAAAFANTKAMVNIADGTVPPMVLGSGIVPQTTIDSLANSIAACVNEAAGGSSCASLFSYTNTPADSNTVQALINIANSPAVNAANIFHLAGAKPPFFPILSSAPASWAIQTQFTSDVLTHHNNAARTGLQSAETILTPANVNAAQFGKIATLTVDGQLYAQPLFTGGLGMPDGNLHDIVFASTTHGSVYAFDSDGNNPSAGYLWMLSLFAAGEAPVTNTDTNCTDTVPEVSLMGTPVIDRSTGTLYVVSKEKITATGAFTQKLHALSLIDGTEKFGGPTVITSTYRGSGDGHVGGVLTFNALTQNQRPALLLANGTQQTAVFNTTPNGSDGGIWMAGGGPAADSAGYIYVVDGNGTYDINSAGSDYGDGGIKLAPPTGSSKIATVADYFVPSNQLALSNADHDVGTVGALLFNDPGTSVPNLMVEADKTGKIYLINTDNMGHYVPPNPDGTFTNPDLQDFSTGKVIFNNFAYFNKTLYVGSSGNPLQAYAFTSGTPSTHGSFDANPTSHSATVPGGGYGSGGVCPVVSANNTASAIVWVQEHTGVSGQAAAMRAYDANNLATEFYNTNQNNARDQAPPTVKFTCPVVANGQVFVGGSGQLSIYGLLP
jgi:hypothetical protein